MNWNGIMKGKYTVLLAYIDLSVIIKIFSVSGLQKSVITDHRFFMYRFLYIPQVFGTYKKINVVLVHSFSQILTEVFQNSKINHYLCHLFLVVMQSL